MNRMELPNGNYSIVVDEHIVTVSLTDSFIRLAQKPLRMT
ncbi:hypothetical protein GMES_0328 [Paraglaciecola mesophila KMM 241]|uniref:Uncharacterized protein n=1 Tax=Paraglaciecola mesophila KMM 241 TaxID=1128912 RepID=K6YWS9_9ALTE|nr:hypothetical protein GMES_0328 [Paraglaciecola mesophila KMM 241]